MSKIIRTASKETSEKDVSLTVIEECGVIADRGKGGVVRLDYGTWNSGSEPKYEIRIWKEKDGEMKATKGIGLSGEELIALRDMLNEMEEE